MIRTKILERAESAYNYPLLIKRILMSGLQGAPDTEICYADRRRYDYATLYQRVCRLANALHNAGVRGGDTVAVLDWDSHRYLECFFAIPMIGAVLHTVNIRLAPAQILYTMNHAKDDFVLVHQDFVPLMEGIREGLETVRESWLLEDEPGPRPDWVSGEYEALLAQADPEFDFPDFSEDSVATTFYTTGTTGNPKGVCFSHRQLVLHTLAETTTLGAFEGNACLRSDDTYMPITPMFHVHAWGVPYAATMLGVKQVYPGRYEPDRLAALIRDEGVTFSHCVPTILQMLLNCETGRSLDLSGWTVLIGGGAFPRGLAEQAMAQGATVLSAYGMSETCPILTTTRLSPEQRRRAPEEVLGLRLKTGIPSPMVELEVVDEAGEPVPHDGQAQGEIVVRAPWLAQSYPGEPERSEELWRGGWLHTGDVATIDSEGFVAIRDRIKDVIKSGGEWISSLHLESLISRCPGVAEVAVIGVPDERWGEVAQAWVVAAAGSSLEPEAVRAYLQPFVEQGELSRWAVPREVRVVDAIPKTSVGKLDKKRIRAQASEES
ncbi:fatty acid--CoA ligase [Motiliproteus sp. SC1-56]|uniref:fatty acid--CoA ligase n=1 Tax=Motiliproteus sp. SC1-56 TaxID=2799565 RepID=UPI001A902FC4|nr:fatty acid--CoA ligase [Motiliproteus sp. SC1-56]